eukprot:361044-Chlamydomonas_euryale.AAC.3
MLDGVALERGAKQAKRPWRRGRGAALGRGGRRRSQGRGSCSVEAVCVRKVEVHGGARTSSQPQMQAEGLWSRGRGARAAGWRCKRAEAVVLYTTGETKQGSKTGDGM